MSKRYVVKNNCNYIFILQLFIPSKEIFLPMLLRGNIVLPPIQRFEKADRYQASISCGTSLEWFKVTVIQDYCFTRSVFFKAVSAAPARFPTSNRCCTGGGGRVLFTISQAGIVALTLTLIIRF